MSVGADVENGNWARAGAMLGTYLTMIGDDDDIYGLKDWDWALVHSFDELGKLWSLVLEQKHTALGIIETLGLLLQTRLSLPIVDMSADSSKFFKTHMCTRHHNKGLMISEMDVIRGIEGW